MVAVNVLIYNPNPKKFFEKEERVMLVFALTTQLAAYREEIEPVGLRFSGPFGLWRTLTSKVN